MFLEDCVGPTQINKGFIVIVVAVAVAICCCRKVVVEKRPWTQAGRIIVIVVSIDHDAKGQRHPTGIRCVLEIKVEAPCPVDQVPESYRLGAQGVPVFLAWMGLNVQTVGPFTRSERNEKGQASHTVSQRGIAGGCLQSRPAGTRNLDRGKGLVAIRDAIRGSGILKDALGQGHGVQQWNAKGSHKVIVRRVKGESLVFVQQGQ